MKFPPMAFEKEKSFNFCVNFRYPVAPSVPIFAMSPSICFTLLFCGIKANLERKSLEVQLTIFWNEITYLVFFLIFFFPSLHLSDISEPLL